MSLFTAVLQGVFEVAFSCIDLSQCWTSLAQLLNCCNVHSFREVYVVIGSLSVATDLIFLI